MPPCHTHRPFPSDPLSPSTRSLIISAAIAADHSFSTAAHLSLTIPSSLQLADTGHNSPWLQAPPNIIAMPPSATNNTLGLPASPLDRQTPSLNLSTHKNVHSYIAVSLPTMDACIYLNPSSGHLQRSCTLEQPLRMQDLLSNRLPLQANHPRSVGRGVSAITTTGIKPSNYQPTLTPNLLPGLVYFGAATTPE
jgi:hypothetical protein